MFRRIELSTLLLVLVLFSARDAGAELGPFNFLLSPFCNVIILSATQTVAGFTLSGSDDRCGASTRSGVFGTAFVNPDGTIGMSLTMPASNGVARYVAAVLNPQTLGGTWHDGNGNSGSILFGVASPAPGAPLPNPALPVGPPGPQ
jgi:hypothetical protein